MGGVEESRQNDAVASSNLVDSDTPTRNDKVPLLAFHMSPRSFDEFVDHNLPPDQIIIAFDELGYGYSDNPLRSCSIDEIADNILYCADQLDIQEFAVVGSLMGCYFSLSLASRYKQRVKAVILTNLYHWPDRVREQTLKDNASRQEDSPISDPWILKEDGKHMLDLWNRRTGWLSADLNTRVLADELIYLLKRRSRFKNGIYIQDAPAFDLEAAIKEVEAPVLCIQGDGATEFFDANGYDMTNQFEIALSFFKTKPQIVKIGNPGSINLVNQNSYEWSQAVQSFLSQITTDERKMSGDGQQKNPDA
jgi:pimeloyl-ACP methyl ester carboxylesterase